MSVLGFWDTGVSTQSTRSLQNCKTTLGHTVMTVCVITHLLKLTEYINIKSKP